MGEEGEHFLAGKKASIIDDEDKTWKTMHINASEKHMRDPKSLRNVAYALPEYCGRTPLLGEFFTRYIPGIYVSKDNSSNAYCWVIDKLNHKLLHGRFSRGCPGCFLIAEKVPQQRFHWGTNRLTTKTCDNLEYNFRKKTAFTGKEGIF